MTEQTQRHAASFAGFFRGKRVLVTGAVGVKATWLIWELLEAGASVVGVDIRPPEARSNFTLSGLPDLIRLVQGDVADFALMRNLLQEVDCVFHLAALVLVGDCRRRPLEAYRTNTLGTATVLEAFRLSESTQWGVFITTDKVYKPKEGELWTESDPLFASGAYQVSKACAEQVIADYRISLQQAGKKAGIARAGNVLVGGDFYSSSRTDGAGRLFVDCFEALMADQPPVVFNPGFTRPYIYGLDVVAGYLSLMSQLDREEVDGEAFNFGPQEVGGVSNARLATLICEAWGRGLMWQQGQRRPEPFHTQALSWEKARQRLGWSPAYTLNEAVLDTVRWYQEWSQRQETGRSGVLAEMNRLLITKHGQAAAKLGVRWTGCGQA